MVRPRAMRSRLALTSASLSGSSALVASSRIRMRGSWISARAIASRWLLAAREVGRAFLDVGLVAVRHALDEFLGAGEARRMHRVRQRQARAAGNDVVADRAAEQEVVLQHHAEALAQMPQVDLAQIGAVDLQEAAVVAVDALQQAGDGGLAGAAAADDAEHGAGGNREADPVERRRLGAGIGEGDVLEADGAGEFRPQAARRRRSVSSGRFSTDPASPIAAPTSS